MSKPPNLRTVELPDCCASCEHFQLAAQSYPDECDKHRQAVEPNELCDDFERKSERC